MLLSSLVSPPFPVSHYLPLFIISSLLTLSVRFSFPLSWVPFVSFTFNNHLYRSFPSVSSLFFFLPHSLSLSATKDDASDKTDGKIISLSFTGFNLLVLFLFFFLFFFPPLHSSPPLHVSSFSLQRVATVPPAVSLMFNPRLYHHPTQHIMYQTNDTSKIIFCVTQFCFNMKTV